MSVGCMEVKGLSLADGVRWGPGSNGFASHLHSNFYGFIANRDLGLQSQDVSSAYFFLDSTWLNLGKGITSTIISRNIVCKQRKIYKNKSPKYKLGLFSLILNCHHFLPV